jgi:ATP-binding cassette subfamily B (MDR/TAP) protein 1
MTTLVAASILGLVINWKLALVCIATIPVLLICGYYRFRLLEEYQKTSQKFYEQSANFACEAAAAMKTVASLTRERDVWSIYHESLEEPSRKGLFSNLRASTLYAASQSFALFIIGK